MDNNTHLAPFLGDSIKPKFGLNHLGLRNSGEVLYSQMLPGLNNVTTRIRYYSFYSWLFEEYYRQLSERGAGATLQSMREFIRLSEYLLALIHTKAPESSGIPGINYAMSHSSGDMFDLLEGARFTDGYWANKGGALMQYYAASLINLGILKPNQENQYIFNISKEDGFISGQCLAAAFRKSVGEEAASCFLQAVRNQSISLKDVQSLVPSFNMTSVEDPEERSLLIEMLLQNDVPYPEAGIDSSYRKDTLKYYLQYYKDQYVQGANHSIKYPEYLYNLFKAGDREPSVMAWSAYHLNDYWQYYVSEIFSDLLYRLQINHAGRWVSINAISEEIADDVCGKFYGTEETTTLRQAIRKLELGLELPKTGKRDSMSAFIGLLDMYNSLVFSSEDRDTYKRLFPNARVNDFFMFCDTLDKNMDKDIRKFVIDFVRRDVIYRHYNVSIRKYYATGVSSNKFALEDGYIRFMDQVDASHASPRLQNFQAFLTDLGLINGDGLTADGDSLLRQLQS